MSWQNTSDWQDAQQVVETSFKCGFCNHLVASDKGYWSNNPKRRIHICPYCQNPTLIKTNLQIPGVVPGNKVDHLPEDIETIYDEARRCVSINAFTAGVLLCRKLLAHLAVEKGADEGKSFVKYVDYLSDHHYIPPDGKDWVDHVRKKGNEATHEIVVMTQKDAMDLISFAEMLLRFIYEFPKRVPAQLPTP